MIPTIISYFVMGVLLTIVLAALTCEPNGYYLSEIIIRCVGTLFLWPVLFPLFVNDWMKLSSHKYHPKHDHLDCRMLRRLRRKARRQIKDVKKTCSLQLMYKTYDGKLHVVGSRSCTIDFSKTVEVFRRQWILQEIENIRKRRLIGAHIGLIG